MMAQNYIILLKSKKFNIIPTYLMVIRVDKNISKINELFWIFILFLIKLEKNKFCSFTEFAKLHLSILNNYLALLARNVEFDHKIQFK